MLHDPRHYGLRAISASVLVALSFAAGCQTDLAEFLDTNEALRNAKPDSGLLPDPNENGPEPHTSQDAGEHLNVDPLNPRDCPEGTFIDSANGDEIACDGCPSGTFTDQPNSQECAAWTRCEPGQFVEVRGSASTDQQCAPCPEGQVSTTNNAGTCLSEGACPAGTFELEPATESEPAECEPCEAGSYCAGGSSLTHPCGENTWDHDADPATDCVDQTTCPIGQFVTGEGDSTSDRSCAACMGETYTLETNAVECLPLSECGEGTFVETPGSSVGDVVCATCAAGSFTSSGGNSECTMWTECAAGSFVASRGSATADQVCEPCAEGELSETVNATACVAEGECAPGTRETEAGTAERPPTCEDCVPGEYCAGGSVPSEACAGGTWDHDADPTTPCVPHAQCLAGSHVASSGDALTDQTCVSCEANTFSVDVDISECQLWQDCAPGTYVQTLGSATSDVACVGCASGSFSAVENAGSCTVWTDCQPGQYVATPGSSTTDRVCDVCASGEYSTSVNAGSCVNVNECPPGTVETTAATPTSPAVCSACTTGTYCAGGATPSVACSSSEWDDDQDPATPCIAKTICPAGQYVVSNGSSTTDRSCAACASGQYSTTSNAASCTAWANCAPGTYVQLAGSSTANRVCAACAPSTFSATSNASSCTAWSVCTAPNYYMTNTPSATTDRACAACTPPTVTISNNQASCNMPSFQMSGGTVVFEAENYTTTSSNGTAHAWSSFSLGSISNGLGLQLLPDNAGNGTQWMSDVPSTAPRLVYNINFTTTGTFNVFIRGDDTGFDVANSVWGGIDNVPISSHFAFEPTANLWGWIARQVTVNTTGFHTFTIWGREDGVKVDKVVISTSSTAPTGNGPAQSALN